jgi:hypothetical protein
LAFLVASVCACVAAVSGAVGGAGAATADTPGVVAGSFTAGLDPRFVNVQGETFFTATIQKVVYDGGPVMLSSTSNGLSSTLVDDVLSLKVTRPDGTTVGFTHDYSGGCGPDKPMAARDLSSLFQSGKNKVGLTLKDKCGGGESASALWLTPQSHIYWTDFNAQTIGRANLDGTDVNDSFIGGVVADGFTSLAASTDHLYWNNAPPGPPFGSFVARANLDGTGLNLNFLQADANFGVAADANYIYWPNGLTGIGRANLDGTGANPTFISDPRVDFGVAVGAGHVYWTRFIPGTLVIGRAKLDGTGVKRTLLTVPTAINQHYGIAVDAHHIYFQLDHAIGRANLDGTNVETTFISTGSNTPHQIAVDAQHVYWAQANGGAIGRANIDGTDVEPTFITAASQNDAVMLDAAAPAPTLSSPGPSPAFSLTGGIDHRLVDVFGETFYTATLPIVNYTSGPVILAGSKDGAQSTLVDDAVKIKVVHQDGTSSTFSNDYSGGCGPDTPLAPTDISSKFKPGANKVTVTLTDVCGGGVSSSPLWLTPGG